MIHIPQNTVITYVAMTVLSAAVSSLPPPADTSSAWYRWFYKFSNGVLANISAIRGKQQYEEKQPPAPPANVP
jgi:hypothetical protein